MALGSTEGLSSVRGIFLPRSQWLNLLFVCGISVIVIGILLFTSIGWRGRHSFVAKEFVTGHPTHRQQELFLRRDAHTPSPNRFARRAASFRRATA
jgi:hypothetical protein